MMMMGMGMGGGNNDQVGAQNEGGGSNNGGGEGEGGIMLKKGPWTSAEDAVLADYVRSHGEGNWNAVQKNTGLARCGKSCRLRWANHLRPNLKKGAFSPEEERIIVELHAKMGNKWARMATQLPGRTDNEIKNYWNTRVKRRRRQGLPLYPPEIQPLYKQHQQNQHQRRSLPTTPFTSPTACPTSSFSFQTTALSSPTTHHGSMLTHPYPLHIQRSASSHILYNQHSTPLPLHSPGAVSTPSPLPSPSHHLVSPLQSPHNHRHQFSTLPPLFDSSTPNTCNNNNSNINYNNAINHNNHNTIPCDFFFPRATPPLQTPMRFKRFKHDTSHESNNDRHDNNIGFNGVGVGNGSSFMLQYPPLQKASFFNAHAARAMAASSPLTSPHYSPSYTYDPATLDLSSSARMLNDHQQFKTGQFTSNPGFNHQSKTNEEHPSNQFFPLDGNSDVTFDTKGNNDSYISNDYSNYNHQNLSMSFSEGGLLDDILEEAQMMANKEEIMRRHNCMNGFNGSSGDLASGQSTNNVAFEGKEETVTDQEINATQEDYSRILNSMPMPEWYNNCENAPTGL